MPKINSIKTDKERIALHNKLCTIPSYHNSISDQMWHATYYSGYEWYQSLIERSGSLFNLAKKPHADLTTNEWAELKIYFEEELIDFIPSNIQY